MHVVSENQRRGAEVVAFNLAHAFDELGLEDEVVALTEGSGRQGTEDGVIALDAQLTRSAVAFVLPRRLRARISSFEPDVVIAHGGKAAMVAALAMRGTRTPLIWHRILEFPNEVMSSPRSWPWRLVLRRVDAVIAITQRVADEVRRLGFRGTIWMLPNHRPWAQFGRADHDSSASALRTELGVDDSTPLVGFVGHLVAQKRPDIFVELAASLDSLTNARFVIAGDGPLSAEIEASIAQRDLAGRVTLLGHRSDVPKILAALDLLVVCSDSETMTGTVIEAQMAGCPVAAFPLDGLDDVVRHGRSGFVCAHHDVEELAQAVLKLLEDEAQLQGMRKNASASGKAFATELVAPEYLRHLDALVGRAS